MRPAFIVDRLLKNMGNMHKLGCQRASELGNPFYGQFDEDGGYWRKEMPNGDRYLVEAEIIYNENDMPVEIKDTLLKSGMSNEKTGISFCSWL